MISLRKPFRLTQILIRFTTKLSIYHYLKVIEISLRMVALRKEYSSLIISLAKEAATTGEPINRPIWWIDPSDEEAMKIDSGNLNMRKIIGLT